MIETQMLQIFIGHSFAMAQSMNFLTLIAFNPMLHYTFLTYGGAGKRRPILFDHLMNTYSVICAVLLAGLLSGKMSISLFGCIIRVLLVITGGIIIAMMGMAYRRSDGKRKKRIQLHIIGIGTVGFLSFLDFICYHFYNATDGARFCRWGAFLYLIMLCYEAMKQFIKLINMGRDSEKIKGIAFNDPLTYLGNRAAYLKRIEDIHREDYVKYGIAMFDLNNLKLFNDVHGHSAGDYYLIICSEIIQDIFSQKGTVYRIGGDEFCAILEHCTEIEFQKGAMEMQERLRQLKGPYTKHEMSVAFGYKQYTAELDEDLSATMERADAQMYEKKEEIKAMQKLKQRKMGRME